MDDVKRAPRQTKRQRNGTVKPKKGAAEARAAVEAHNERLRKEEARRAAEREEREAYAGIPRERRPVRVGLGLLGMVLAMGGAPFDAPPTHREDR